MDTAGLMWTNLKKRYAVASAPKIDQLKASLADSKLGSMDVVEFHSTVISLWSELEGISGVLSALARNVSVILVLKSFEEVKAHQFLMGLNDETYTNI